MLWTIRRFSRGLRVFILYHVPWCLWADGTDGQMSIFLNALVKRAICCSMTYNIANQNSRLTGVQPDWADEGCFFSNKSSVSFEERMYLLPYIGKSRHHSTHMLLLILQLLLTAAVPLLWGFPRDSGRAWRDFFPPFSHKSAGEVGNWYGDNKSWLAVAVQLIQKDVE